MNLIFDLGANVGGNIEYYLSMSQQVLAVEANPILCQSIRKRFQSYINQNRLILIEACLSLGQSNNENVNFFINKFESGLSRFTPPKVNPQDFYTILVPAVSYLELIEKYGVPDFVKIDLEGYDKVVLNYLIEHNLLPDYLQFENQGFDMLKKIVDLKVYNSYNIVSFYNFEKIYNYRDERNAGPIDLDIKSPWLSDKQIINLYQSLNYSWLDIHLSKKRHISKDYIDYSFYEYSEPLLNKIKLLLPPNFKSKIKSFFKISR